MRTDSLLGTSSPAPVGNLISDLLTYFKSFLHYIPTWYLEDRNINGLSNIGDRAERELEWFLAYSPQKKLEICSVLRIYGKILIV